MPALPPLLCILLQALPAQDDAPRVYPGSTCKLEQVTGELDVSRGVLTRSRTHSRAGLLGTDLGSSFEHEGKLWFLFGDSFGGEKDADVIAWTDAERADQLALSFHTDGAGRFRRLQVPGVSSGPYEIPSYGISLGGAMYVVFTTDYSPQRKMQRSVLARSKDDGRSFERLFDVSTRHFINVALERASAAEHPGLPAEDCVLVWGSGEYRASSVRLACAPAATFDERASWRYLAGVEDGAPRWVADETGARELFDHPVVGELSVAWIEPLGRWVMLYNSTEPRGIVMRTAREPWGPWTAPELVFEPWLDRGYANFMHVSWEEKCMDTFHDPRRTNEWGGEYGPYLIPRFASGDAERCTLVFTMSTWNPYQVVLMSTEVGRPPRDRELRETRFLLGDRSCTTEGPEPARFSHKGVPHVTTWGGPRGDRDLSVSHRALQPKGDSALEFTLHGGGQRVVLVREERKPPRRIADIPAFARELMAGRYGPVVESIAGPHNNDVDVPVRWNLARHAGERLRLYLVDSSTEPWGFVSVSAMTLRGARGAR